MHHRALVPKEQKGNSYFEIKYAIRCFWNEAAQQQHKAPIMTAPRTFPSSFPFRPYVNFMPTLSPAVRVVTEKEPASSHRELSASPLNPKDLTPVRSENEDNLEVWYFKANPSWLDGDTPEPLSETSMRSTPNSFSFTSTCFAPASLHKKHVRGGRTAKEGLEVNEGEVEMREVWTDGPCLWGLERL